jgi:DNA-directed RNA polymerase I subunit RPA1
MQQNNIVIRSEVSEVQFGLYSDADIRHLSCCQISSPIAFDGLGNAINNGLYDPKLGPTTQYGPPCVTCGLIYMNCPGHSGHIELCVPVSLSLPPLSIILISS